MCVELDMSKPVALTYSLCIIEKEKVVALELWAGQAMGFYMVLKNWPVLRQIAAILPKIIYVFPTPFTYELLEGKDQISFIIMSPIVVTSIGYPYSLTYDNLLPLKTTMACWVFITLHRYDTLLSPSFIYKDPCDYIGPTWVIQHNLPISRSADLQS